MTQKACPFAPTLFHWMQVNKKTLVILSPGFPASEEDTTCLPAQQLFVQHLRENFPSLNVMVLAFQYPFARCTYQWKNVTVISFNGMNRGKTGRLHTWLRVWRGLRSIVRQHEVIGLFSFWCTECALVGKYFGKRARIPHYTWILGQDARKQNAFVRLIRPKENELVAMSAFLADEFMRNHGVRPKHIIPNGIDPRMFPELLPDRPVDVMGAGSLIPLKQYDLFTDLVAQAREKFPGIKAIICGKGPEEKKLQLQIHRLGLEHHLTLAGERQHPQVLELMQQSKIFLHTSSYEGFGTVHLEALYAGAQVISFCNPMQQKIPNWHVVTNREEMLQKIIDLLNAPPAQERILPFTMQETARSVMKLFGH
jgi:glycosyltransferase involved in cell wall biosynthesis